MTYSQKPFLELMKAGQFPGEITAPKHIETVISNVFVFEKNVYKLYKNDSDFFNSNFRDISTKEARFFFTRRDFEWNNALSPTIYTKTLGVAVKDGKIETCTPEEAEDLVIVMNRINTSDILYEILLKGEISEDAAFSLGKQYGENIKRIQEPIKGNYHDEFLIRVKDLQEWIRSASDDISLEESLKYCDYMVSFTEKNRAFFEGPLSAGMTKDGDVHSHNAVFSEGKLYLIDTFPPKEDWLRGHPHIALYRFATDLYAFTGRQEIFEAFMKGYVESGQEVNRDMDPLYILYAAGIMVSYQYMLAKSDPHHRKGAERYHAFIRDYFEKHCSQIPSL
jgi:aminoglycoside phosphotransferase family enzyme